MSPIKDRGLLRPPSPARRRFLSRTALSGLAAGLAPQLLRAEPGPSALRALAPAPDEPDAAAFAEARRHFLIPEGVAYGNTGTLGACPREVIDALTAGLQRNESQLADWPYEHPDG